MVTKEGTPKTKHNLILGGILGVLVLILVVFGPLFYTVLYPERTQKVAAERQNYHDIIAGLPADGIYSADAGSGGSYKDPIHGFFEVEPPNGFVIEEDRERTTIRLDNGQVVARSRISFKADEVKIGVTARGDLQNVIDDDLEFVLQQYRLAGVKIERTRFVTIDGVRGAEVLGKPADYYFLLIKYKKHSLDHSIVLTCYPASDFPKLFKGEFLPFLHSHRSLKSE